MQINLVQPEIHEALTEYINKDFDLSGKDVRITLIAGRGEKGHSASIDILPAGTLEAEEKAEVLGEEPETETEVASDDAGDSTDIEVDESLLDSSGVSDASSDVEPEDLGTADDYEAAVELETVEADDANEEIATGQGI